MLLKLFFQKFDLRIKMLVVPPLGVVGFLERGVAWEFVVVIDDVG